MLKLFIFFGFITTLLAGGGNYGSDKYDDTSGTIAWWDTDDFQTYQDGQTNTVPFPQCLISGSNSKYFQKSSLQKLFDRALREVEESAIKEQRENYAKKYYDNGYSSENKYGYDDYGKGRIAAAAAIKLTKTIMTKLACNLTGTDSDNFEKLLNQFASPGSLCTARQNITCQDDNLIFRTATGICNNLIRPYEGSAQTAFGRFKPAEYADGISEPRRKSYYGGYLPSSRKISLALGSKPIFNRNYNNLFIAFGQFIAHDIALSVPVSDTYSTPISSCGCSSKYDWNKCTVIDIQADDPYLRWQKCMAFPATAQAFKGELCSLGVKEQLNGDTTFLDLSNVYGNNERMADILRSHNGTLKSTRKTYFKYELPPAQREGKSCIDAKNDYYCFAGGDSRIGINLAFTGVQTLFLRAHNDLAKAIQKKPRQPNNPWTSDEIYQFTRLVISGYFQRIVYEFWLPILLGSETYEQYFKTEGRTTYNPQETAVIYNEFATAAFRLHSLVRDLFSRCTADGKRVDEVWLHDILQKVKYAYDVKNNGIDSILCGTMYDYGFTFDGNFAHQIHHRLFESTTQYGQLWRNDLVSINIARGREHGIPGYNTYREFCNLTKAYYFEDFGDTINYDGIKLLKRLYKHVEDVDLWVALNLEDPIADGLVGPVSMCLIVKQFLVLRDADRFFYNHKDRNSDLVGLPPPVRRAIENYPFKCFICSTMDIDQVAGNPFQTPSTSNPLEDCSSCVDAKEEFYKKITNYFKNQGQAGELAPEK